MVYYKLINVWDSLYLNCTHFFSELYIFCYNCTFCIELYVETNPDYLAKPSHFPPTMHFQLHYPSCQVFTVLTCQNHHDLLLTTFLILLRPRRQLIQRRPIPHEYVTHPPNCFQVRSLRPFHPFCCCPCVTTI